MLITIALVLLSLLSTTFSQASKAINIPSPPPKQCSCGYRMHDTKEYFTHAIFNDFGTYEDANDLNIDSTKSGQRFTSDWTIQSYLRPAKAGELRWGYNKSNVWIQGGRLNLRQVGYTEEDSKMKRPVLGAEIVSKVTDMYHCSFRAKMRVLGANGGTVASLNWYRHNPRLIPLLTGYKDDSNEIDVEILGKNPGQIEYTVHPTQNSGKQIVDQSTSRQAIKKPWTAMQEYRFDWNATGIHFYEDNHVVWSTAYHIPRVSGAAHLTLWASGSQWTGFPSSTNVTLEVVSLTVYYNTTATAKGTDPTFNGCQGKLNEYTVCNSDKDDAQIRNVAIEKQEKNVKISSGAMFFWSASVGALALAMCIGVLV